VVVAFGITALLTLLSTVVFLILDRSVINKDKYDSFNPIDKVLRQYVCRPVQAFIGADRCKLVADALYDVVESLSDTQLVTGNAVLIAAVKKLQFDGTITLYHFSIASDLAWFSSNTHLLSSIAVQGRRSIKSLARPDIPKPTWWPRPSEFLRILLKTLLATMLLYTCWVMGFYGWTDEYNCPVACITGLPKGGEPVRWTITNFVLILYSYPFMLLHYSKRGRLEWVTKFRHKWVDDKGLKIQNIQLESKSVDAESQGRGVSYFRAFREWIFLPAFYFLASELASVLEQITWFTLGVYWTWQDRTGGHSLMTNNIAAEEDSWGFGQIVPMLMLLLPLLQFLESWKSKCIAKEIIVPDTCH
jgi:hypothetical protein